MGTPTRRAWVKLHVAGWLHGSIRWQMTPEERSVWADLLALAGEIGHEGMICDNDLRPLPLDFVASLFHIKKNLLAKVIDKNVEEGRLTQNKDGVIKIANWTRYQSEYARQKKYRDKE